MSFRPTSLPLTLTLTFLFSSSKSKSRGSSSSFHGAWRQGGKGGCSGDDGVAERVDLEDRALEGAHVHGAALDDPELPPEHLVPGVGIADELDPPEVESVALEDIDHDIDRQVLALDAFEAFVGVGVDVARVVVELLDLLLGGVELLLAVGSSDLDVEELFQCFAVEDLHPLDGEGVDGVGAALLHRDGDLHPILLALEGVGVGLLRDELELGLADLDVEKPVVQVEVAQVVPISLPVLPGVDDLLPPLSVEVDGLDLFERAAQLAV